MIKSLRVRNLRCLKDTKDVELRPITVLVGRNSSGKSTLLRLFPLLKQSLETSTSEPVLWYGDYVDFGSIDVAARAPADSVTLEFEVLVARDVADRNLDILVRIVLEITKSTSHESESYLSRYAVSLGPHSMELTFSEKGDLRSANVDSRVAKCDDWGVSISNESILCPELAYKAPNAESSRVVYQTGKGRRIVGNQGYYIVPTVEVILVELAKTLGTMHLIESKRGDWRKYAQMQDLLYVIPIGDASEARRSVTRLKKAKRSELGIPAEFSADDIDWEKVSLLRGMWHLITVSRMAEASLTAFLLNSSYAGPVRAHAQRFYRVRGIAVDEVDFRGDNFPMFVRSLSDSELASFSGFLADNFDIGITRHGDDAFVEIKLIENKREINLIDAGFGYSQILPVAAQIWGGQYRLRRERQGGRPATLLAIEQPELHLHPAHQSKLADLFARTVKGARESGSNVRFVVETHSEAIVNRLGALVEDGVITRDEIQILVFGTDSDGGLARSTFSSDGTLENWPYGFFS